MGANMARRLKDCGFPVAAVFDANPATAAELAGELGALHARTLAEVTAAADIVFTVVSDEKKDELVAALKECQKNLFPGEGMKAFVLPAEEAL